jgi:DnaJ domain
MDPHAVLGLPPGAAPRDVSAAYRRLAKRWHPDRGSGHDAERRMAEINAAYDLLRATAWTQRQEHAPARVHRAARGAWLAPAIRLALGHELLGALEPRENVWLVTPATTWASPQALLAASDRRLLWLLDDAISDRVHSLRYSRVSDVSRRLAWPRRRTAILSVLQRNGRRVTFADLTPATAQQIIRHVRAAIP